MNNFIFLGNPAVATQESGCFKANPESASELEECLEKQNNKLTVRIDCLN